MSALPPKADMCGALAHFRFGPKADIDIILAERSLHATGDCKPRLTCGYQSFHCLPRLATRRRRGSSPAVKLELNLRIRAPILGSFR